MAGRIPQAFIDELINRVDIFDVIDRRVQLQKKGREYQACCPFHTEKTPSFTVSSQKQFYHCFGCGAHGTAIGFLMDYEHMEFVDAIETLASEIGIEVPREESSNANTPNYSPVYRAMELAVDYYQKQLSSHPAAHTAIDYLKDRGLTGDIAKTFGIGFAPPGWNNLSDKYKDHELFKPMIEAGLIGKKDGKKEEKTYDRFRNRILFPIRDRRGRPIAFGGRIIDPNDNPKYLNSPETPIFHKGETLYGLYEARQAMRHLERFIVVEGYMDVVALAQHGIQYAVATLGTATTPQHLTILFRLVSDVVFCFDGDRAGKKAAWKALEMSLPMMTEGRQVSFLFLPDGEDPDTQVRKIGQEQFEQNIAKATPLSEFLINHLEQDVDSSTPEGKNRFAERVRPLMQRLPDNVYRELLIQTIAERVGLSANSLMKNVDMSPKRVSKSSENTSTAKSSAGFKKNSPQKHIARTPVRAAIAILLQNPAFADKMDKLDQLRAVSLPGIDLLAEMIEIRLANPNITTASFLERWRDTKQASHLGKLSHIDLPGDEETLANEFYDIVQHLMKTNDENRWAILQQKVDDKTATDAEKREWQQLFTSNTTEQG